MNDTNTTVYNLPINHRNDISILNYAKKIINKNNYDMPDESVANSTNMGKVIEAEYSDETLIKYIKNSIIEGKEYKDWFVLGRSNAQVEEMFNTLSYIFEANENNLVIVWVHNLSYEFAFIKKYFKWLDVFSLVLFIRM